MSNSDTNGDKRSDVLNSVSVAAFDVDARIFRTIWFSIFKPADVALGGLLALLPFTVLLTAIGQLLITFLVLDAQFDLLLVDLFSPPQPDIGVSP